MVSPTSPFGLTPVISIPSGIMQNPPYEDSWTFSVRVFKAYAVTEKWTFSVSILADPMTTANFNITDNADKYKY